MYTNNFCMFYVVRLSTAPPRMFEIAFKMFDLNGDGNVEYDEFEKVATLCKPGPYFICHGWHKAYKASSVQMNTEKSRGFSWLSEELLVMGS